jgi:lipoprotein-releasing system permease protein
MSLAWFVARRYLTARRRQAFISLISAVSILGVGVGVMALVIALALMTGVQTELRDRIVGATAHIYVSSRTGQPLEADREKWLGPGVAGAAPAIIGFGVLTLPGALAQGATLKGIDPARESDVTDVGTAMVSGSLDALGQRSADQKDGVVLGAELARALGVAVGDVVTAVTPEFTTTLFGLWPRFRALEVVGIFRLNFYEVDSSYALVALPTAAALLKRDGADMMQLRLDDMDSATAVRERLQAELGAAFDVRDWTQLNQPLYSALWLEKVAISLTIGLIVMVAALNIVASLVLLVMEKSRDIAILRTMGASTRVIRRIFVYQGLTIGLLGTIAGAIAGLLACFILDRYELIRLPGDVYQITHLPFRVETFDLVVVVVSAIGVCLLATLYPSRQAARIDPAEALRNQ